VVRDQNTRGEGSKAPYRARSQFNRHIEAP
jgi:hypothetical protein